MPRTYGAYHQNRQIFNQADKAVIEMKNSEHFGWKFDGNCNNSDSDDK